MEEVITRTCCRCGETHPITFFEKNKNKPYGRGYRCYPCSRARAHTKVPIVTKSCEVCGKEFETNLPRQKYCSKYCLHRIDYSGDYRKLIARHLNPERSKLDLNYLMNLLEKQDYKCALTGVPMTAEFRKGYVPTNVSLDRINAGEEYTNENVQLVCCIVNSFRSNLSVEEYIGWCRKVTEHNKHVH